MIENKRDLKEFLSYEKKLYLKDNFIHRIKQYIYRGTDIMIYKYIVHMRKEEFYCNTKSGLTKILGVCYHKRIRNKLGRSLGIEINGRNNFGKGLKIWHPFAITINGEAKIGEDCQIRGNVCIGNDGKNYKAPEIGNNVDIGYGAIIVGEIKIANNVKIGANAFVNKSFTEENVTIAGIPAKIIK